MPETPMLSDRALRAFAAWSGYPLFADLMKRVPDLDLYLAGGAVRNLALGQEKVRDFDLFLGGPGLAEAVDRITRIGVVTRGVYGNIHWKPDANEPVRADLILIPTFKQIRPATDMVDALNQFDFTGNAIAVDLRSGDVLDPQKGVRDMERRIMRAVRFDQPERAITPNHVLTYSVCTWFRILHYAAALELEIEPVTMSWLLARRHYRVYREAFAGEFKEPHPRARLLNDEPPSAAAHVPGCSAAVAMGTTLILST
jgi:hypothetical protein